MASFILQEWIPSDLSHVGSLWEVANVASSGFGTEFVEGGKDLDLVICMELLMLAMGVVTGEVG